MRVYSDIKTKIKSENGASIAFALLLFLVCIVVSTIIITAATAASGRLSNLAKMDQKYYLVNSVAEMIEDTFNNEVVVVKTIEKDYKGGSGNSDPLNETHTYKYVKSDTTDSVVEYELEGLPLQMMNYINGSSEVASYTLTLEDSNDQLLTNGAVVKLSKNGYGKLIVAVSDNSSDNDRYTLSLIFNYDNTAPVQYVRDEIEYNTGGDAYYKTTETVKEYKFVLNDVKKGLVDAGN